jgi:hypothetical protein
MWKKSISINPIKAIKMAQIGTIIFLLLIANSHSFIKINTINLASGLNKWIIKSISIKTGNNSGLVIFNYLCKDLESLFL